MKTSFVSTIGLSLWLDQANFHGNIFWGWQGVSALVDSIHAHLRTPYKTLVELLAGGEADKEPLEGRAISYSSTDRAWNTDSAQETATK